MNRWYEESQKDGCQVAKLLAFVKYSVQNSEFKKNMPYEFVRTGTCDESQKCVLRELSVVYSDHCARLLKAQGQMSEGGVLIEPIPLDSTTFSDAAFADYAKGVEAWWKATLSQFIS